MIVLRGEHLIEVSPERGRVVVGLNAAGLACVDVSAPTTFLDCRASLHAQPPILVRGHQTQQVKPWPPRHPAIRQRLLI